MLSSILLTGGFILMFCMAAFVLLAITFTIKETVMRWFTGKSMIYTRKEMVKWNR